MVSARDGRYIRSAPTLWATTRLPLPSEVGIPAGAPTRHRKIHRTNR
ncbi:hypothetical protein GS506_13965 [Rhodococcus hoagii]|nr:hypothetical protein [Prescottella equi]